jgi:hypothetical protein
LFAVILSAAKDLNRSCVWVEAKVEILRLSWSDSLRMTICRLDVR